MPKPITQVATTDITDMMSPGTERRMELPGFDAEFVDFPHYIIRITERIWHDREVELCKKWYSEDCAIHTMAGDISGAQTVVDNTHATLRAFPDRRLDADNVIWSDEGGGAFYSSHLITSKMTNQGPSEFGPTTGRRVRIQTIADCLCKDNRVIEEWLVRDNLAVVTQLGLDPDRVAREQAAADLSSGTNLIEFHASNRSNIDQGDRVRPARGSAAHIAVSALNAAMSARSAADIEKLYDFRCDVAVVNATSHYGPDELIRWHEGVWSAFSNPKLAVEHIAEIPYLGEARDVAVRWSLRADHTGGGRYGDATGAEIYILGVSQFRVMNGRIREEVCIWDDLALRRQVETARLL